MSKRLNITVIITALLLAFDCVAADLQPGPAAAPQPQEPVAQQGADAGPLVQIGPGDSVMIHVYGQPDMDATEYVSDDGSLRVALAGPVSVAGLSPTQAAQRIEKALVDGRFFVKPQVVLTVAQARNQHVFYIYGQVQQPNMYKVEDGMTVVQAIARAGGITPKGSDRRVEIRRRSKDGQPLVLSAKLTDTVQPDDVIRVKESIF